MVTPFWFDYANSSYIRTPVFYKIRREKDVRSGKDSRVFEIIKRVRVG